MKLQTIVNIPEYEISFDHHSKLLSLGSCFSDNIGNRLSELWFDIAVNPFGVLFNPISIANLIERSLDSKYFTADEIQERDGIYFLFDTHSNLASTNAHETLKKANEQLDRTKEYILKSDLIILTFGTAFYYELKEESKVVGNCHKMPGGLFDRKKVQSSKIVSIYSDLIDRIKELNPKVNFLFTVSPIRHSRDGFIENNRSKAELILAVEQICEAESKAFYFPAYEIQMDELRDYRFYAEDLNHPNKLAIDHIFTRFTSSLLDQSNLNLIEEIRKINIQEQHKPLFPDSSATLKALEKLKQKKAELQALISQKKNI